MDNPFSFRLWKTEQEMLMFYAKPVLLFCKSTKIQVCKFYFLLIPTNVPLSSSLFMSASFCLLSSGLLSYSMPLLWAQWIFQNDNFIFFFLLFIVVPDYPAAKCISGMSSHQPSRNKSLLHFSFAKAIASSISWDTEIENSFVWDFGLCWHKAAQVFRRAVDVIIQGISFPCCLFIFFFLLVG